MPTEASLVVEANDEQAYTDRGAELAGAIRKVLMEDGAYRVIHTMRAVSIGALKARTLDDQDSVDDLHWFLRETEHIHHWTNEADIRLLKP